MLFSRIILAIQRGTAYYRTLYSRSRQVTSHSNNDISGRTNITNHVNVGIEEAVKAAFLCRWNRLNTGHWNSVFEFFLNFGSFALRQKLLFDSPIICKFNRVRITTTGPLVAFTSIPVIPITLSTISDQTEQISRSDQNLNFLPQAISWQIYLMTTHQGLFSRIENSRNYSFKNLPKFQEFQFSPATVSVTIRPLSKEVHTYMDVYF